MLASLISITGYLLAGTICLFCHVACSMCYKYMKLISKMVQIEANSEYTNKKRTTVSFLPNDPAAASFLEVWTPKFSYGFSGSSLWSIFLSCKMLKLTCRDINFAHLPVKFCQLAFVCQPICTWYLLSLVENTLKALSTTCQSIFLMDMNSWVTMRIWSSKVNPLPL